MQSASSPVNHQCDRRWKQKGSPQTDINHIPVFLCLFRNISSCSMESVFNSFQEQALEPYDLRMKNMRPTHLLTIICYTYRGRL
ncbi:hypothetical protein GDO81_009646 [Engystomops pustulosus]|uniref:Uncharacterized protein n=1 Tax=Engystomops pustulosus TaxID=76066 RepID=A0AAV7BST8_ENGPU|nr:hypothetical protein GDO81_009646 [Engystomops pustulosus]